MIHLKRKIDFTEAGRRNIANLFKDKPHGAVLFVGLACEGLERVASQDAIKYLWALPEEIHSLIGGFATRSSSREGVKQTHSNTVVIGM